MNNIGKIISLAKQIWVENDLENNLYWEYDRNYPYSEYIEPTIQKGFVEYDGWKFYTSDNRNYVKFESPDGIVGTFIKDCENY